MIKIIGNLQLLHLVIIAFYLSIFLSIVYKAVYGKVKSQEIFFVAGNSSTWYSLKQNFIAHSDMQEGIGTVALLQAIDKSLQTVLQQKVSDILIEHNIEPLSH